MLKGSYRTLQIYTRRKLGVNLILNDLLGGHSGNIYSFFNKLGYRKLIGDFVDFHSNRRCVGSQAVVDNAAHLVDVALDDGSSVESFSQTP
jgi:hypothetical protein